MMRVSCAALLVAGSAGVAGSSDVLQCHAISAQATDSWCNSNCNNVPAYCPSNLCSCDPPPTPAPAPPSPTPAPAPPSPTPAPAPPSPLSGIKGYYSWNWGTGSAGPPGANAGCAFTGLIDVKKAISQYPLGASWCCPTLAGTKYLTLGGGNSAGIFNEAALTAIASSVADITAAGYEGVMFDVEEVQGSSGTMVPAFANTFAAVKGAGLRVAVTTSHSAPYQCDTPEDAVAFVKAWAADANIDILSPQLYSSGSEGSPEYAETNSCKAAGCTWDLYKGAHAAIAPSIVDAAMNDEVHGYFDNLGISTVGFFEWKQRAATVV